MFWDVVLFLGIVVFGLFNVFAANHLVKLTWVVRHGIDEEGERSAANGLRFFGVLLVAGSLIWLVTEGWLA